MFVEKNYKYLKNEMIQIELLVYDFDGVMTDNTVYVNEEGNETVSNRSDGLAISKIKKLSVKQIIISTEKSKVVSARAKKLNIDCFTGIENKESVLKEFCSQNEINLKKVGYVGNDINDLEAMKLVGTTFCPSDSHPKIKKFLIMF